MRNYLLQLLFSVILNACFTTSYGQDLISAKPVNKVPEPFYILNSNIIVNGLVLSLDPKKISEVIIYRDKDAPDLLRNLASTNIVAMTYDGQISSKSFAEVGNELNLHSPFSFVIDGHKLNDAQMSTLRIVPEAIGQLKVIQATSNNQETTVNIQLVIPKKKSQKNPPGTIMIR